MHHPASGTETTLVGDTCQERDKFNLAQSPWSLSDFCYYLACYRSGPAPGGDDWATVLQWLCSCFQGCFQKAVMGGYCILSLMLLNIYLKPLEAIAKRCGVRCYPSAGVPFSLSILPQSGEAAQMLEWFLEAVMDWILRRQKCYVFSSPGGGEMACSEQTCTPLEGL